MLVISSSHQDTDKDSQKKIDISVCRTGTYGKRSVNNSSGDTTVSGPGVSRVNNSRGVRLVRPTGRLAYFKHDTGHVNFGFVDCDGMKKRCEELESLQEKGDSFGLHKKVKDISSIYKKHHETRLKNDQGNYVHTQEELAKTWANDASSLFADNRPNMPTTNLPTENLSGPPIIGPKWNTL
ncbi:uncharacterized protein [Diabrotica undecimpunctata]|uniref:uncharacterized protein n=1 Tax=Diabrotica undecimpunctata TaxID=50387 RepID=UPI003B63BB30